MVILYQWLLWYNLMRTSIYIFFSVKSDVQRRFRAPICNQLFKRARAFLNYERRQLKSREQLKLYELHRNSNTIHRNSNTSLFTGHINSLFVHPNRQCSQSTGNFEEYDSNISYNSHAEFSQIFVTDFDCLDFDDCSYNYLWSYNSKNFVDFSEDLGQPIPLNQQPDRNNKASSRTICNRRFDKQRRKRSSRGGRHKRGSFHSTHCPIDLSSRSGVLVDEAALLSKGPSFCPVPRDINWHRCRLDWQSFVDKVRWADFYFDRNFVDISSSPDILDDNLGPFQVKSGARAPVSKDIALETFLATIENKLFDVHRARHYPVSNLSKSEHKTLHRLRTSKDIVVRLQDKGSRFVILDRTDYIDKVESNLNDGSFDLLPADLSSSYYQMVRDWGVKWVNKGEIGQPLLDYIINPDAKPGKNYGLIKTHKPNNPIRLITSGNGTAVENLSLFTEYFLHPCVKKEPQILIDTTALLKKVEDINRRFSPFPAGTLLVSWDVISMYPSIDNKVGLDACKTALDRREKLSPSTDCLLEAIKITLECNNSTFNNKHYRQNRGTAMGPHNACSYADLAMTTIDHKILDTNTRPNDITFPPDWSRFQDDCFSPWFAGVPSLLEFTEWLNSISDSIKFTVK